MNRMKVTETEYVKKSERAKKQEYYVVRRYSQPRTPEQLVRSLIEAHM